MATESNTRAYLKVGDEWVELPRVDNGFAIKLAQGMSAGSSLTIKTVHSSSQRADITQLWDVTITAMLAGAIINDDLLVFSPV